MIVFDLDSTTGFELTETESCVLLEMSTCAVQAQTNKGARKDEEIESSLVDIFMWWTGGKRQGN